jgi:probable F420-dependent oxidoreductase
MTFIMKKGAEIMKFGLFGINMNVCSDPDVAARVAQAAEAAGFESVWTGEHVVLPDPQAPPSPLPPLYPLLDPAVALAFIAAHTKKVKLGTGIIILPQRNPLVLAKELASVDVVSGGRLIFGLGIGYLKAEFDALGAPFDQKGPRSMDYLQAMKAVWTQEKPTYQGQFVSFKDIQARPQPVQKPHPPVVIGGHTKEAFQRAVQYGNGWYGFALDVDAAAKCLTGLKDAAQKVQRPAALGPLEISITPGPQLDLDMAKRYADLGVQRLIPFRRAKTEQELLDFVGQTRDTLIGKL